MSWRRQYASEIVGESPQLLHALENLRRVAETDATLVLTGETGTGKDLLARAAHRASPRRAKPFIPVNCAALQESLLENEMFGHVRGAYTGATQARAGRFLAANGGTLFLDEIGELSPSAQAKLLRVLEDRAVTPVGSDSSIPIDVRVIAATHRDLDEMVRAGRFRADLYFRITVVTIDLPPLRERGDDLDRITDVRIAWNCERYNKTIEGIDKEARAKLRAHSWPGNVRELCHCIEQMILLSVPGPITAADVRLLAQPQERVREHAPISSPRAILSESLDVVEPSPRSAAAGLGEVDSLDLRSAMESLERNMIRQALSTTCGNRTEAAALLGLNRTTLVEKIRKYGV
ncbi:MAG: sigma 54-interacting transcriptional regulator [Kofleriaceae bacterium]